MALSRSPELRQLSYIACRSNGVTGLRDVDFFLFLALEACIF